MGGYIYSRFWIVGWRSWSCGSVRSGIFFRGWIGFGSVFSVFLEGREGVGVISGVWFYFLYVFSLNLELERTICIFI